LQTFAEISCVWDYLMGTYPQGHYAETVGRSMQDDVTAKAAQNGKTAKTKAS
jgi:sterol desaturase/sphingolipid hydroxylase (fatty acid hydroxylase superfamily)